jgi:two-component system CheB/CheR fusion protein
VEDLRARLAEAEETLRAIRSGEVDALVVSGSRGDQVFTLHGADHSYRIFLEQMNDGALTLAADGTILYSNRRFADLVWMPLENVIGGSIDRFFREADQEALHSVLQEGLAATGTRELTLQSLGGAVPVYLTASALFLGGVPAVCLVVTDLTEQKRNERLVADERLARSILEHATEAIVVCDTGQRILRASLAAQRWFGEAFVGEPFAAVLPLRPSLDDSRPAIPLAAVLDGQTVQGIECSLVLANGEAYQLLVSAGPLYTADDRITGCVVTMTDITERRQAEMEADRARREAEAANQAKDRFLATLSHELRTPLTPVLAVLSSLGEDGRLPAYVQGHLAMMRRNVELEARLIDDMLDLTRVARGKIELRREVADLKQILEHALQTCMEELLAKRLRLIIDLAPEDHYLWGDVSRLTQVFWNLLNNAVKFTPRDGVITIRSMREEGTAGAGLAVEVSDTGVGIGPDALESIFDAFNQGQHGTARRFGGLGLGLAISKAIVGLHGGALQAASAGRGRGSCFTVRLPVGELPPAAAFPPADLQSAQPADLPRLRILLVEDHADTAEAIAELLRLQGHRVATAGSVEEALALAGSPEDFDLVVSDLGLPDGNGVELMRELSGRYGLSGIALSGYGMEEDVRQSLEAGFRKHLTKPVNMEALKAALREVAG